jgi:glycosyltransferase involved in cell wall biosynthesis
MRGSLFVKIFFVDTVLDGHHLSYLKQLHRNEIYESVYFIPEPISNLDSKQYIYDEKYNLFNLFDYYHWLKDIKKIIEHEKPDIIHFLYGDRFYRFFGIGLSMFKDYKTIVTFHQTRKALLNKISLKSIFSLIDIGIVHTEYLLNELSLISISNVAQIEYPDFNDNTILTDQKNARKILGINTKNEILLALGGTRNDKGLDLLLEALNYVSQPFHLLIAGAEQDFTEEYIKKKIERYRGEVTLILKYLSEKELNLCLQAADYIVLPYRKIFDGASGPLVEGVGFRKIIVGPNHGSLGEIIEKNKLGPSFEAENIRSLSNAISSVLKKEFYWNELSENYRLKIDKGNFSNKYEKEYTELLL